MKLIQISEITLNCLEPDSCFSATIHAELSTNINILCQGCDESVFYLTSEDHNWKHNNGVSIMSISRNIW